MSMSLEEEYLKRACLGLNMKGSDMRSDFEGCCQLFPLEQLAAPRTMAMRLAAAAGRDETAVPVAPAALFLIREVQYPVESSLYNLSRGARGSKCTAQNALEKLLDQNAHLKNYCW